ncbi:MAG TPA: MinD/ParA family protein [Gammaproteobacteria bacterium]|nr:MinD/ParA family protein [Gammaproteobacteria bacterium]
MPAGNNGDGQASGLRQIIQPQVVRVIAVTSGKGGVGKTNISANLALAMAQNGHRVMLMDADMGLANLDVIMGLQPKRNLSHVLAGRCDLDDVIVPGPMGISVIPAASGVRKMASLSAPEIAGLIHAFSTLRSPVDVLIVDTAAGIHDTVTAFCLAAQEVLMVVCDEPASITDAYALCKLLSRDFDLRRFRLLANRVQSFAQGRELYNKVTRVTDRFLDVVIDFVGAIPEDPMIREAVQAQQLVVEKFPSARASVAFRRLASDAEHWPQKQQAQGQLQFFFERLVQAQSAAVTT